MEGSEDEPSEDNAAGSDKRFSGHYENCESEGEFLSEESLASSPERSEKSSWSCRSREAADFDLEEPSCDNHTVTSQGSLRSGSRRSLRRENSMASHRGLRRYEDVSQDDDELDGSSEGDRRHRGRAMSSEEEVTDEDAAEETVIETSCDEASFNTSIYSYKETGSSSELSIDPVVWKKFKFLTSILKETQHNLRAMDDLILEHRRIQGQPSTLPHPSHTLHQASTPQVQVTGSPLHPDGPPPPPQPQPLPHQQALSPFRPESGMIDVNIALHHSSPRQATASPSQTHPHPHILSPNRDTTLAESHEGKSITFTSSPVHSAGVYSREGGTYSNGLTHSPHTGPDSTLDARIIQQPHQESLRNVPSYTSHGPSSSRNIDHMSGSLICGVDSRVHKKDNINQTDPLLLVPRMSEEHHSPHHTAMGCQTYQSESFQGQETLHHPLMKETRSLRKEIDDIMARKQALDSRMQSLIAHRAMQRELEAVQFDEPKKRLTPLTKSKSLEDGELRRSKSKHGKYKARSKSYEEESHLKRKSNSQEAYLSMINENQDEFPSLTMESIENDDKITELQTDEADIPGLGDSGLSSEINSINATIQELVKENQQLHKFLLGMTSESILKVDQEKLALEAKLQSLDKENESLKICLDEDKDLDHGRAKALKGVTFCINEANEEPKESEREAIETGESKAKERENHDHAFEVLTASPKMEDITQKNKETGGELENMISEAADRTSQSSSHQEDTVNSLKSEIDRLTKQNQQLVNIIEKERHVETSQKDSPRTQKSQSTIEEVSVSSIGESLTEHSSTMKELDRLQQKVNKLTEEKKMLEFKLSNEASERDFESTRLEARIQILSDLNQTLTHKLSDKNDAAKTGKAEMCCQTDTLDGEMEREGDTSTKLNKTSATSVVDQTTTVSQHVSISPDKQVTTSASKASLPNSNISLPFITTKKNEEYPDKNNGRLVFPLTAEESLASRPHLKDLPLHMLSSDENISTDDDKMSLIKTPREDIQASQQSEISPRSVVEPGDALGEVSERKGNGTVSAESTISKESSTCSKHSQVQQLEALVAQNKVIASSLSELKLLSKTSESNRESAFIKIMEENVRVMQNIGEKLASASLPAASVEPDARLTQLSQENQDLKSSIQQQQKRIEILINQNSSLEKKLHVAQHKGEEAQEDAGSSSGSDVPQVTEDETPRATEGKVKKGNRVFKEIPGDVAMDSSPNGKQKEALESSRMSEIERRQPTRPSSIGQLLPSLPQDQSGSASVSPDQAGSSRSYVEDTSQHSGGSVSSRKGLPDMRNDTAREKRKRSSVVLDPETQRLLDAALRKEKEARTRVLQEAELEKEALQERIVSLVRENDCLAARLQEVVSVSRNLSGHMHSVKDQLERVEAEKDNLHRKVKSLEDGQEDSSLSPSDSIGSSRLTHRLKERVRNLQDEVERGWQEAHQRTVERDKAVAEKESLEYTSSIAINTARREAESLREQVASLQDDKEKRWLEQTNLQNELERKSVIAKAAQESQASHLERLVEAERKIETLQNDLKKIEEQLLKETESRKNAVAELEEMKAKASDHKEEKATSQGEQHWANTVAHLRSQLQQEQLRAQLLEAGEQESSGRILSLQHEVRNALQANQQLQDKYNQLRTAYRAKRAEKASHRELSRQYTAQVKELGKTTAALEENFKAMLCGLGESIEVTVELLASHVFLTPCLIHPGPALHQDPEAWFGAQQGRLRWLQSQLRKLCLHNWKTGNLPRTSNLDSSHFDVSFKESQSSPIAAKIHIKEGVGQHKQVAKSYGTQHPGVKVDVLSELSILDEGRSYTSTPVRRRSSASDISFSAASSPIKLDVEANHSTPKPVLQLGEVKTGVPPPSGTFISRMSQSPGVRQGSVYLSEAERILTSQQKELSETKYRQYKALIYSLQQDLDKSTVPSPSIPSSLFTTPEKKVAKLSQDLLEDNDQDSLCSELSVMEVHCSHVSSASASPTLSESSRSTQNSSGNSIKDSLPTCKKLQSSQNSLDEKINLEEVASTKTGDSSLQKSPKEHKDAIDSKQTSRSSSRASIKSPKEDGGSIVRKADGEVIPSILKEDQQSCGLDVDKDRDSWEAEEDLIRMLVESEIAGSQD
ncbi:GRIP and coiled-coil domain-containing protein 2-like isoform X2 [Portunus trituberculatus]|uniref:GRIP and coiled-coil domain-containing protein 2-like isoform X2 n=1 Tax=Portunus trituberculatus TaxID=210409 RepID=UPI001E1D0FD2|nr:GRIP and coiled-coil domain-containing protein 2-like isoform X2 [Portunus trituberculatus]